MCGKNLYPVMVTFGNVFVPSLYSFFKSQYKVTHNKMQRERSGSKTLNIQFKVQLLVTPLPPFSFSLEEVSCSLPFLHVVIEQGLLGYSGGKLLGFGGSFSAPAGWSSEFIGVKRQCGCESVVHQMIRVFPV